MNRKLLTVAVVAAAFGIVNFASRAAQSGAQRAPFDALVTPVSCAQPQWPAEARRYEIEGATSIRFEIGLDGKVLHPAVIRSSGWRILDDAALQGIARCVFKPELDDARKNTGFPLQYVWKLNGPKMVRARPLADSCQEFTAADPRPSDQDGILLRFLLDAQGVPKRIVAEGNGQPQARLEQAASYLQSCRFAWDAGQKGERTDTAFGRVLLK